VAKFDSATSFNFGANLKAKKPRKKKPKRSGGSKAGNRSNAWRKYVASNAPLPD
jgi:hypothetical protein